ncbi:MAG: tetratricopeptide repeat protein [Candidatus Omnitrophota bacterium]
MPKKSLSIIAAVIVLSGYIFLENAGAETIFLKTGEQISAKILEKNDEYVVIDFNGTPITYCSYEIEKIEADSPQQQLENQLKLADQYKKQKDYASAKKEYEKVIELDPKSWIAYTELANIYSMEKEFTQAQDLSLKALEYNEKNYLAWSILGTSYYALGGNLKKAEEALIRSMEIQPNNDAFQGLLLVTEGYEKNKQYKEARNILSHLSSFNPPADLQKIIEEQLKRIKRFK